jgi:uncharacterized protein YbaA (DUF1428 family)
MHFSARDKGLEVMADERLAHLMEPGAMPFDSKRMIWGGFKRLDEI